MRTTISGHIATTAGTCGGRPRISGHRIRVQDVVVWHETLGLSPEEIVSRHPQLTLADVYSALAYYHDHREEIRSRIAKDEAQAKEIQAQTPSLLLQRLAPSHA